MEGSGGEERFELNVYALLLINQPTSMCDTAAMWQLFD
jgi:hypothetical protein